MIANLCFAALVITSLVMLVAFLLAVRNIRALETQLAAKTADYETGLRESQRVNQLLIGERDAAKAACLEATKAASNLGEERCASRVALLKEQECTAKLAESLVNERAAAKSSQELDRHLLRNRVDYIARLTAAIKKHQAAPPRSRRKDAELYAAIEQITL